MIEKLTGKETAQDLTNDLRERILNNNPYPREIPELLKPFEPYVKVSEIIEPHNNYRSFEVDGFFIIPIATYVGRCRTKYTMFNECVGWAEIYGKDSIYVGVISKLITETI